MYFNKFFTWFLLFFEAGGDFVVAIAFLWWRFHQRKYLFVYSLQIGRYLSDFDEFCVVKTLFKGFRMMQFASKSDKY